MPSKRIMPPARVEVIRPLTILSITWRRRGDEGEYDAVRIRLDYSFRYATGDTQISSPIIGIDPTLSVSDGLLERFIGLGTSPEVAAALSALGDEPDEPPVVLKEGTLAALMQYGITPEELLSFLLKHGAAKRIAMFSHSPNDPERSFVRTFDPLLTDGGIELRLRRGADSCRKTALALARIQRISLAPQYGVLPPLSPQGTAALINELVLVAMQLEGLFPQFSRSRGAPSKPLASEFCREWYDLATKRSGDPLYEQGAALYALAFDGKPNPASFESLCRRPRSTNKNPSGDVT